MFLTGNNKNEPVTNEQGFITQQHFLIQLISNYTFYLKVCYLQEDSSFSE
jgi:hypothetical protein